MLHYALLVFSTLVPTCTLFIDSHANFISFSQNKCFYIQGPVIFIGKAYLTFCSEYLLPFPHIYFQPVTKSHETLVIGTAIKQDILITPEVQPFAWNQTVNIIREKKSKAGSYNNNRLLRKTPSCIQSIFPTTTMSCLFFFFGGPVLSKSRHLACLHYANVNLFTVSLGRIT